MRITVIIPVYNIEKYLQQCVESVLNQTFSDLEIILVNDGSTDSSAEICDAISQKDQRIIVIHQKNAGVSAARNAGIRKASGDYLTFVDSDDWIEKEMYKTMLETAQANDAPDVVMCDFMTVSGQEKIKIGSQLRTGTYHKKEIIKEIYPTLLVTEDFGRIPIVSTWNCLFRTELIKKYALFFDEELRYSEDYLFMAAVMTNTESYYYLKDFYFYNYRQIEDSRSKKYQPVWWETLLSLNRKLVELLQHSTEYNFERQLKLQLIHSLLFVSGSIVSNGAIPRKEKIELHQKLFGDAAVKKAFKNIQFDQQKKQVQLILFLMKRQAVKTYLTFRSLLSALTKLKTKHP